MAIEKFKELVKKPESNILDYKLRYEFHGNKQERTKKQKKFVIDVVSFSNTICYEPSYIIIGITDNRDFIGLEDNNGYRDDAILQQIVNNFDINPFPNFTYDEIEFEGKFFGVIEFPLPNFNKVVELEGIVYGRYGSSNMKLDEARREQVDDWLKRIERINFEKLSNISSEKLINKLIRQKDLKKAKEELIKSRASLNEKLASNLYLEALLYEIEADRNKALELYKKAYELDEKPKYLKEIPMLYYELGDYHNAVHYFDILLNNFNYDLDKIDDFLLGESVLTSSEIDKAKFDADLAAILLIRGKKKESKIKLQKSYERYRNEYGEGHERTQNVKIALDMINLIPIGLIHSMGIEDLTKFLKWNLE